MTSITVRLRKNSVKLVSVVEAVIAPSAVCIVTESRSSLGKAAEGGSVSRTEAILGSDVEE